MTELEKIMTDTELDDATLCKQLLFYLHENGSEADYEICANFLINYMTMGFYKYFPEDKIDQDVLFLTLKGVVKKSQLNGNPYFISIVAFFEKKYDLVYSSLEKYFKTYSVEKKSSIDCSKFVFAFVMVFKNAVQGFWDWISTQISQNGIGDAGIDELCNALEMFYYTEDNDVAMTAMSKVLYRFPDMYLAEELLAVSYYSEKLWKNAIAYYERLLKRTDPITIDYSEAICFNLASAYGNTNNHIKESERYEETLRLNPKFPYANNNLGYSYYQQRQFKKALELFDNCVKEEIDTPYCYNNKVRTLLALGENKEALEFAKENKGRNKVSNDMFSRAERASKGGNKSIILAFDNGIETSTSQRAIKGCLPSYQFSSERILEDELVSRIDKVMPVFGIDLRVYEVEGDYYGRQYPIDGGRIDILATDEDGNLYAIELKKDSGYDDAYEQTRRYVDWLKKFKAKNGRQVFGIICLNSPSENITSKMRNDREIRLFEYGISYNEIL